MSAQETTTEHLMEQPSIDEIELLEVMKALSDPARLTILSVMSDFEYHSCSAEVYELEIHKSTLSHHFKVLREAGITSTRLTGRNRDTRLRKADLDARFPGLLDSLLAGISSDQPRVS